MTKLKECQAQCEGGCESCAADVLYDAIAKMKDYITFFNNTDDEEAKKEFVRSDMIKYINDNNKEARDILIIKATEGSVDDCQQEKLDIYKITKYEEKWVGNIRTNSILISGPQCGCLSIQPSSLVLMSWK